MKSAEIRRAFLNYFASQQHEIVASSPLVPANDPSLLFTNAGMVQFKDVFLGEDRRPYARAASSQCCVRAGGKHNDLENVGYTARHHTFFEMLGNFSFGDYFKREAIGYAWQFLTEVLRLPPERLWVTVHLSDDEAADIWLKEIGVNPAHFSRLDEDNFWQMGDTGPCGPCSEIFYDHGEEVPGGPPGSENDDLDRYIEIWNLVFMQYQRAVDGTMTPLPKPSIDTGMGLERIAAVMQGVHSNYEIDLFQNLIKVAAGITGCSDLQNDSLKVIADHIRSCSFLVLDGVLPSNEGRGYVLRRIIRRALRHGNKLGCDETFFYKLVSTLADDMSDAYPELKADQTRIEKVLKSEEEQFANTLDKGMDVLNQALKKIDGRQIPGAVVFQLYDTYGFPVDLTSDIARERGLELDIAGYEACMDEQRARARAAGKFRVDYSSGLDLEGASQFTGYERLETVSKVKTLLVDGREVEEFTAGQQGAVVLEATPFYAESGGQVGDTGYLTTETVRFQVDDCQKEADHHLHLGRLEAGILRVGDRVAARVDAEARRATALNHSATHLLHAALRQVLGEHVTQKGSLVDAERLRFDFSHPEAVTGEQLKAIERLVNRQILDNSPVRTDIVSMDEARKRGAMALFGEKYGEQVRLLTMAGGFSVELCGGTHVARTGDIGLMRIVSESGISAGVRRIEAITGAPALEAYDELENCLNQLSAVMKTSPGNLVDKARQLVENNRKLGREVEALKSKLANSTGKDILADVREIAGIKVLATAVEGADAKSLRNMSDNLKSRLGSGVVFLASTSDSRVVSLVAGVTKDLTDRVRAGDIMSKVAPLVGGKGGGRPDMAQGGGSNPQAIPEAIEATFKFIERQLRD